MSEMNMTWLTHINGAIPPSGIDNNFSVYIIALEGWRRGLKLKFYRDDSVDKTFKVRYELVSEEHSHRFEDSRGDLISQEAIEVCNDKYLTKKYLERAGVSTPEGEMFQSHDSNEEIFEYAKKVGFPLVIKPLDANGGKGVFSNITNLNDFKMAVQNLRGDMGYRSIIVERYIEGDEYRVIVVDNKVHAVLKRLPANVIGNGKDTIRELIRQKNQSRNINPHLRNKVIKSDVIVIKNLKTQGYKLDDIPKNGEYIKLRLTSNLSTGGDSIDMTDNASEQLKNAAIDATKAIPGLGISGIDVMVNESLNQYLVIEANTKPGLGGHMFPGYGKSRDIASAIIDYYFPETRNTKRGLFTFDFSSVVNLLRNFTGKEVEITNCPRDYQLISSMVVRGVSLSTVDYARLKEIAMKLNVFFEAVCTPGHLKLNMVGKSKELLTEFESVVREKYADAVHESLAMTEHKLIPIGYSVVESNGEKSDFIVDKEMVRLEKERELYYKKYMQISRSPYWKATAIFRKPMHFLKKKYKKKH